MILALLLVLSCNGRTILDPDPEATTSEDGTETKSSDEFQEKPTISDEQVMVSGSEDVAVPLPISGAYLTCQHESYIGTPQEPSRQAVGCSVRNKDSHALINIDDVGAEVRWFFEGDEELASKLEIDQLAGHATFHAMYRFNNLTPDQVLAVRTDARYAVEFKQDDLVLATAKSGTTTNFYDWLKIDGSTVPANAVSGGTESQGATPLYLCRVYVGEGLYPGKLIQHYNDATKSICYTVANDAPIESQSTDASTLLYANDIVTIDDPSKESYFKWVAATQGDIPENAVAGGYNDQGVPLYVCRNQEGDPSPPDSGVSNDPDGEPTPGYIAAKTTSCVHEHFGINQSGSYEVLVDEFPY
jgi:hypothetical protein